MNLALNSNGITIDKFEDVYNYLVEQYKAIYGSDINLAQDTPDGQRVSIETKLHTDLQEFCLSIYNSFDPDLAVGNQLHRLLKLVGIRRSPATKSTVSLEITTDQTVTLQDNYTVEDSLGQSWVIATPQSIDAGTHLIDFKAQEWGAVEAKANTITSPAIIELGINSVTNPDSASIGLNEETDIELRQRRAKSVAISSENSIQSLTAKLLNLNGVKDAVVYENYTHNYDSDLNLNAHSIWCVIDGGLNSEIAKVITSDKNLGCGLKGSIEETTTKQILKQDGTFRDLTFLTKFDRPTQTQIYLRLNVRKKSTSTIDFNEIKKELESASFSINENITITELYSFIYNAGNNFIASDLELSKDNINFTDEQLVSDYSEILKITQANINITEIV